MNAALKERSNGEASQTVSAPFRVALPDPISRLQRILEAFGFTLDRTNGSHRQYKHPLVPRPLSIQPRSNMAKPYQIDQFLDIVQEFGLTIVE